MPTLLDIGADQVALNQIIAECDEELTPEVEAALDAWWQEIQSARDKKLDGYVALIREHELRAEARQKEMQRIAKRANADANVAARLKDRLKTFLEINKLKKVQTERYSISLCGNGGNPPMHVGCVGELPPDFVESREVPLRNAIFEALKAGEHVPGCMLLARGTHLRIN